MDEREGEKCVCHGHYVEHIKRYFYAKQPNCLECDGFGEDANKYGWGCYEPNKLFIRKKDANK